VTTRNISNKSHNTLERRGIMKEILAQSQMEKVRNFEKGFVATHLIHVGSKLGLFQAISEARGGLTPADLAAKLGLHEPYVKIWCQTAYHFEMLDVDAHGRFTLQPFSEEILADRSHFRNYLGNIAVSVDVFGKLFDEFPEHFRTGLTVENLYTPEMSKAYYETTRNMHLVFRYMIIPKNPQLKDCLENGCKFLDVGCGRGSLIIELAQLFDLSSFVGVDPNGYGIERAREMISKLGLEKRVTVEHIGGEALAYDNQFDVATMVANLHEINPDLRGPVIEKVYKALKPDGQFLILDFPYPVELADFRNELYDFAILDHFRKTIVGHDYLNTYKRDTLLTETGFKKFYRRTIGKGMFELVTAVK